ncbi:MAG TPA: hypothetical protein VGG46_02585 [Terriglobales bacterium]
MVAEESFVGIPDQKVKFASRWFRVECSGCGSFLHLLKVGHHGTQAERKMKTLFPKTEWKRLRAALDDGERRLFNETLEGKRMAEAGEVKHWVDILKG